MTSATPTDACSMAGASVGVSDRWRAGSNSSTLVRPCRFAQFRAASAWSISWRRSVASAGTGRDARGERARCRLAVPGPDVHRRGEEATGDGRGGLARGAGQEEGELVATGPEGAIHRPQGGLDEPAERGQCLVAGGVPAAIVDGLEVVEVDEDQAERDLAGPGGVDLALECLLERAVVAEPGDDVAERVASGQLVHVLQPTARCRELLGRTEDLAGHPQDEHGQQRHEQREQADERHRWRRQPASGRRTGSTSRRATGGSSPT